MIRPVLCLVAVLAVLSSSAQGAVTFKGTVTDPDGTPVEGVDLDVEDLDTGERVEPSGRDDETDADGKFKFDVPEGYYEIRFDPPGRTDLAPRVFAAFDLHDDERLDVQLDHGLVLSGLVTGPDLLGVDNVDLNVDEALTGVRIPTSGDDTNSSGIYDVTIGPGVYDLTFRPRVSTGLAAVRLRDVKVAADAVVNVSLEAGFSLTGNVLSTNGMALDSAPDVGLELWDVSTGDEIPLVGNESAEDGSFEVVVLPGSYRLGFVPPLDTHLVPVFERLDVDSDRVVRRVLEPGLILAGTVRDRDGTLVEGADFRFLKYPGRGELDAPARRTKLSGKYAFVLPPATYDVVVRPPDGSRADTTRGFVLWKDLTLDVFTGGTELQTHSEISLLPPFPNPSRGPARIELVGLSTEQPAVVRIVDVRGRLWRTLFEGMAPANRRLLLHWDGKSDRGIPLASGVYFVELSIGSVRETKRYVVVH